MGKIVLDATATTLELTTSSTSQVDYYVAFADYSAGASSFDHDASDGAFTTATTDTIVAAPGSGVRRLVDYLSLQNVGAESNTVTIHLDRSGTDRVLHKVTLGPNEGVTFDASNGWTKRTLSLTESTFAGYTVGWVKVGTTTEAPGVWHSLAAATGGPGIWVPGTPGMAGRATDGTTANDVGCLPIANAASGFANYLDQSWATGSQAGGVFLVDVLWVNSGIAVTTTTAQTVNSVAFPARDQNGSANGEGVYVAIYVTSATTNAGAITSMTMSYTNSAGTAGRTATMASFPATAVAGTLVMFQLASGDDGVRSVQSVTLGTSLVTGAVSLLAFRILAENAVPIANVSVPWLPATPTPSVVGCRLYDGVCIQPWVHPAVTTAANYRGSILVGTRAL